MQPKYIYVFDLFIQLPLSKPQLSKAAFAEDTLRSMNQLGDYSHLENSDRLSKLKKIKRSHQALMKFILNSYQETEAQHLIDFYQQEVMACKNMRTNAPVFNYYGYPVTTPFLPQTMWLLAQGYVKCRRANFQILSDLSVTESDNDELLALAKQDEAIFLKETRHLNDTIRLTTPEEEDIQNLYQEFYLNHCETERLQCQEVWYEFFCKDYHPVLEATKIHLKYFGLLLLLINYKTVNLVLIKIFLMTILY